MEGFKDLKRNWSVDCNIRGLYGHILGIKLKALKQDLKSWSREVFGNVITNKVAPLNHISFWDAKEREVALSIKENEIRREAMEEFR